MIDGIQGLANMEYALYGNMPGGYGAFNAPSVVNGYCAVNPNYYNQYYNNYNNLNQDIFTKSQNNTTGGDGSGVNFNGGFNQNDINTLANYYYNNMSPSESLGGAAIGGIGFAALQNPRLVVHPVQSLMASFDKDLNKMFADATKKGTELNKLWTNPETNPVVREAYFRAHKIKARTHWKTGLFRKRFTPEEMTEINKVMKDLEKYLAEGNTQKIAECSAKLEQAYVSNGWLPRTWNKIRGKETPTVAARINDSAAVTEKTTKAMKGVAERGSQSLWQCVKKSCTLKSGLGWAAFEALFDAKDIVSAFKDGTGTGIKQLGQTAVKGAGSAVGWMAGEALGTWAATKALATVGTAIAPGIGTAIGAVAGFVVGSIGMWLTGKVTKRIVGENVGAKAEIRRMKQTPEGQAQLLALTAPIAEKDKNLDPRVRQAFENIATQYSLMA